MKVSHDRRRSLTLAALMACVLLVALPTGALFAAEIPGDALHTPPTLGASDAPITIVEYADFQCAYCIIFARDVKPLIEEHWIDTGRVRLEFRHYPWIGATSRQGARASVCAHAQGGFWAYHDHLYGPGHTASSESAFIDVAALLGLDEEAFTDCLTDERVAQVVEDDHRTALSLRLTGTPAFFVNGRRLIGAYPYEVWSQLLESVWRELDT